MRRKNRKKKANVPPLFLIPSLAKMQSPSKPPFVTQYAKGEVWTTRRQRRESAPIPHTHPAPIRTETSDIHAVYVLGTLPPAAARAKGTRPTRLCRANTNGGPSS